MQTSKIVEVDGVFIGAAVCLPGGQGWLFVAADHRAGAADGRTAATLYEAQQIAKRAFFTCRSKALAARPADGAGVTAAGLPMPTAPGCPARI